MQKNFLVYGGYSTRLRDFSKGFTQLSPEKMSRCLSLHPDGWDVKTEVPGDLTRQAFSS